MRAAAAGPQHWALHPLLHRQHPAKVPFPPPSLHCSLARYSATVRHFATYGEPLVSRGAGPDQVIVSFRAEVPVLPRLAGKAVFEVLLFNMAQQSLAIEINA